MTQSRYTADNVYYAVSRDGKRLVPCVDGTLLDNSPVLAQTNSQITRGPETFGNYTWRYGDRMDALAASFVGDAQLYWAVLDMNEDIFDPTAIEAGEVVVVPDA